MSNPRAIPTLSPELVRRFWTKVGVAPGECWEWLGGRNEKGYGQFHIHRAKFYAHRVAYTMTKGPVPVGLVVDHLCRNPGCVNPDHLEPVTTLTNTMRGSNPDTQRARHAAQTHCHRGHEFTDENTYTYRGSRTCRACRQERKRIRKATKRQ